jgi:hypothetical protein
VSAIIKEKRPFPLETLSLTGFHHFTNISKILLGESYLDKSMLHQFWILSEAFIAWIGVDLNFRSQFHN